MHLLEIASFCSGFCADRQICYSWLLCWWIVILSKFLCTTMQAPPFCFFHVTNAFTTVGNCHICSTVRQPPSNMLCNSKKIPPSIGHYISMRLCSKCKQQLLYLKYGLHVFWYLRWLQGFKMTYTGWVKASTASRTAFHDAIWPSWKAVRDAVLNSLGHLL